jgi:hypothetical protein
MKLDYRAQLIAKGKVIWDEGFDHLPSAKTFARSMLDDFFAISLPSSHRLLGTQKAQVVYKGGVVWEMPFNPTPAYRPEVVMTPTGREIRTTKKGKWECQPPNDNYWIEFDDLAAAMKFATTGKR